jgi:hypothetical protein
MLIPPGSNIWEHHPSSSGQWKAVITGGSVLISCQAVSTAGPWTIALLSGNCKFPGTLPWYKYSLFLMLRCDYRMEKEL